MVVFCLKPREKVKINLLSLTVSGEHDEGGSSAENPGGQDQPEAHSMTAEELENFASSADEALKLYDVNDDGYISYKEFLDKMLPENQKKET